MARAHRTKRTHRRLGSPPLPARWPKGRGRASFCRGLEQMYRGCGHAGSGCREQASDRALAAGCPWAVKMIRPYSGRLWRD